MITNSKIEKRRKLTKLTKIFERFFIDIPWVDNSKENIGVGYANLKFHRVHPRDILKDLKFIDVKNTYCGYLWYFCQGFTPYVLLQTNVLMILFTWIKFSHYPSA